MGIQERPFENIISMNNSLSGDPINELITLNKLERSIYSEGRKLETIILLSGMTPKDRWIYISLILDDLLYQYDSSCRKVRGMNTNTLLYKRALLLKKAIVEVMEVTSTRLKIAFDIDYIKEREERYATTGAARWDDSTDKKLDLDIVESMRYFNDLISGKIDRYLENCKSRFTKKYDDDKLKAIWLHLKEENYINSNTSLDTFLYLFGNVDNVPERFYIEWLASLKELHVLIDVFPQAACLHRQPARMEGQVAAESRADTPQPGRRQGDRPPCPARHGREAAVPLQRGQHRLSHDSRAHA